MASPHPTRWPKSEDHVRFRRHALFDRRLLGDAYRGSSGLRRRHDILQRHFGNFGFIETAISREPFGQHASDQPGATKNEEYAPRIRLLLIARYPFEDVLSHRNKLTVVILNRHVRDRPALYKIDANDLIRYCDGVSDKDRSDKSDPVISQ